MTGNNTMKLNQATMQKIVQYYFDTVMFKESPKVSSVRYDDDECDFIISIADRQETKTVIVKETIRQ